jgi:hypothetical protein
MLKETFEDDVNSKLEGTSTEAVNTYPCIWTMKPQDHHSTRFELDISERVTPVQYHSN